VLAINATIIPFPKLTKRAKTKKKYSEYTTNIYSVSRLTGVATAYDVVGNVVTLFLK
jgi:hypothetical protein